MITPCTTPELATEAKEPLMIAAHRTSQAMCEQPVNLARRSARDHFRLSMPHGPDLCVRRLGTLRGHRSLTSDLTLRRDNTAFAASVWSVRRKL